MLPDRRPGDAQPIHQIFQIVVGTQPGRGRAVTQAEHHHLIRVRRRQHQGQILVLLVEAVEQGQLLRPVRRVVHGVEVESQRPGRLRERGDELVHEQGAQPEQRADVDLVLKAGQGRLTGQVGVLGRAVGDEFEDGIGSERVVVVLVFVAGEDSEDAHTDHVGEGVLDELGVARVVQGLGELLGKSDALVELAQGQQPGVRGEGGVGRLDVNGQGFKKVEKQGNRLYTTVIRVPSITSSSATFSKAIGLYCPIR